MSNKNLGQIHRDIIACHTCPRLIDYCRKIAQIKRRAYIGQPYWGRPVAGFGDPHARLMIVGLAPGAHGANRTGRVFTGDRSGEWLYRALYEAGFSNQPGSQSLQDGLQLHDAYVTCVVKCAPPENKPLPSELTNCKTFLQKEIELLPQIRIWIALGQVALKGLWPLLNCHLNRQRPLPRFQHGEKIDLGQNQWLLLSYHPSQQNTFTGKLTKSMFDAVFSEARNLLNPSGSLS